MSAHTPGPWTIREGSPIIVTSGPRPEDVYICTVSGAASNPGSRADAALIAAAPDLLAALKAARHRLVGAGEIMRCGIGDLPQIDAAIAKAEGR